jgi:predicted nucleic acid-binding protein
VLDACVLYPVVTRDLLLTLAADDAFEPIWTDEIIDEMRRNIVADRTDIDVASLDTNMILAMDQAFPEARLTGHKPLIARMDNHPKDRHVAAAAVHAGAHGIVTYNLRDFRSNEITRQGIVIITPPTFVEELVLEAPDIVARAIQTMSRRRRRPPVTPDDVVVAIERQQGFGGLSLALHDLIN